MFAGHVGVALAVGRAERRVNVGVFVAAALLLDLVLWLLILLGWEFASIPANFARTHQAEFVFPYSHGLISAIVWSALAGAAGFVATASLGGARGRAAALIAAAVFSHWLLDALVHQAELPLLGPGSMKVGLGLWHNMQLALVAESTLVWQACGASFRPRLSRRKSLALSGLVLALLAFTVAGMTIAPAPPSSFAMAASSLVTLVRFVRWRAGSGGCRAKGRPEPVFRQAAESHRREGPDRPRLVASKKEGEA